MGSTGIEIGFNLLKMFVIFFMMIQAVPILVWLERRGSAFIQNRFGPNRVGPLGLIQLLADAVKFLWKEEFLPKEGVALLYYGAPIVALIPGALAFGSIPLGPDIHWGSYIYKLQSFEINVGIVFVMGVSSLGAYSLLMAGYGSSNKYSLMGALRASAQMISYELALGLSLVGILLTYGTFDFKEIVNQQQGPLHFMFLGKEMVAEKLPAILSWLPNWGIFFNPVGMILFAVCAFAESNRLPFDLPEAEGELVAGFHTEYGGFKMLMFYIGEYGHMIVASALIATFYLGGYGFPGVTGESMSKFMSHVTGDADWLSLLVAIGFHVILLAKIALLLWIFIWVRWTLPRFRYDQLMDLGWKTMLPWALGNTVFTAIWIFLMHR